GQILIAPGGHQMRLQRTASGAVVRITDDPPEKSCKPSVNYLFRSAAEVYGRRTLAVMLTGMGDDGLLGCKAIKNQGGVVIAQDQASCVVFGMPRVVIENGLVDAVTPLSEIPDQILRYAAAPALACR
ncbi:MAG: CheB methylesterase domain-containing protein, partial [Pyrinomonadaceae bacterium]